MERDFQLCSIKGDNLFRAIGFDLLDVVRVALLVGSHAEGLSTSFSDLDILIVVEDSDFQKVIEAPSSLMIGRWKADVLVMKSSQVRGLMKELCDSPELMSQRTMELIHKLVCGANLLSKDMRCDYLCGMDKNDLLKPFCTRALFCANSQYLHFAGLYIESNYLAALDSLKIYFRYHLDAYLFLRGDVFPTTKWLVPRMQRTLEGRYSGYHDLMNVLFAADIGDDEAIRECIKIYMVEIRKLQLDIFFPDNVTSESTNLQERKERYTQKRVPLNTLVSVLQIDGVLYIRNGGQAYKGSQSWINFVLRYSQSVSDSKIDENPVVIDSEKIKSLKRYNLLALTME